MTNWKLFNAESEFGFGIHAGRTLEQVMSNQASYIVWCIRNIDSFLIEIELLEAYVGKYDNFVSAYDPISKKNVEINVNPFNLSAELKNIVTQKWDKFHDEQSNLKINNGNNADINLKKINSVKTTFIQRCTEEEQKFNSRLLMTFECIFSANSFNNLKEILHPEGKYFEKMNRQKACGYFYNLFFGKDGSSEKFHMEVNRGISMDFKPGEIVLELRCSTFDPFCDNISITKKAFGTKPDPFINEKVYLFAFSFKDEKIFSIRVPKKCVHEITKLISNN
jgi:hypothetical protein